MWEDNRETDGKHLFNKLNHFKVNTALTLFLQSLITFYAAPDINCEIKGVKGNNI